MSTILQSRKSRDEMVTRRGNEIYERHLCLKGRGFPLWIPEPNKRLPLAYQKRGIAIGDVGIITRSGAFSFLFNICVPSDNPINPRLLPEGFAPIYPPLDALDVAEFNEFKPGSYLASASIENLQSGFDVRLVDLSQFIFPESLTNKFRGLAFETSASEGAILTLPEGAVAFDLENVAAIRNYVAANMEKWYRFVNGVRGREAKNGDVRVVIGCDKTTSWGMAALANNVTQHKVNQLKFKATGGPSVNSARPLYSWDYSGVAEVKVGPDIKEVNALRSSATAPSDEEFSNQCLFIRTLNATLNTEAWKKLHDKVDLTSASHSNPWAQTTHPEPESPPHPHSERRMFNTSLSTTSLKFDHLGVPTQSSRPPYPCTEKDANGVSISTTPDAIVSQRPTSRVKLPKIGARHTILQTA